MAIYDDITAIYHEDQLRLLYDPAGSGTVYTKNAFYSWRMDEEDELWNMSYPYSMSAQTPVEYTMENGWFVPRSLAKKLKTGALSTLGWDGSTYARGIRVLQFGATYTNCVASDVGKPVLGGTTGDGGTLMDYDNDLKRWWVRQDSLTDVFDDPDETVSVTGGTGTGSLRKVGYSGEDLWAGIYTLGELGTSPDPLVYLIQERTYLANLAIGGTWYSRGHIDLLVKVKEGGVEIDGALLRAFIRKGKDSFAHYNIDLSSGGRQPVVLQTGEDLNITKPDYYLLADNRSNGGLAAGNVVVGGTSEAEAIVFNVEDLGSNNDRVGLIGVIGAFSDGEDLEVSGSDKGDANGTMGDMTLDFDNESGTDFATGQTITGQTYGATGTLRGVYYDTATTGFMAIEMAGAGQYLEYADDEQISNGSGTTADVNGDSVRAVAGFSDVLHQFIHGTLPYDGGTGGLPTVYEVVTGTTSGAVGVIMSYTGDAVSGTLTLANVIGSFQDGEQITDTGTFDADVNGTHGLVPSHTMDYAFEAQPAYPYDCFIGAAGRPIQDVHMYNQFFSHRGQESNVRAWSSGVRLLQFTGAHGCVETDLDKVVTGVSTGDTGKLLSYTSTTMVVLVDDPSVTGDLFDEAETVNVTAGTGSGTTTGCSSLVAIQGQQYQIAYTGYSADTAAAWGKMAGSILFCAQGVIVLDMDADDVQNQRAKDSNGVQRTPPNKQKIEATSMQPDDSICIYLGDGAGNIDKEQFTSAATGNNVGDSDITVQEAIDAYVPASGVLVVRDEGAKYQYRMRYTAWDTSTFDFPTAISGSTTSDGGRNVITDSGASFLSENIQYGDPVRNSTDGSWAQVISVDSDTQITTSYLRGGSDDNWQSGDGYEFHTLPATLDGSDFVFVPFIDKIATSTSESVTQIHPGAPNPQLIYVYRKKGIKPQKVATPWAATGTSLPMTRLPDPIVS